MGNVVSGNSMRQGLMSSFVVELFWVEKSGKMCPIKYNRFLLLVICL